MNTTFETWKFEGRRYIATEPNAGTFHVADELGNNYGTWQKLDHFKREQKNGTNMATAIGNAKIQIVPIR